MSTQTAALKRAGAQILERRRFRRVPVTLAGRFMLPNREEHPCQTVDMSPGDVLLRTSVRGALGDRVIVYLEHIGRLEGTIARMTAEGFALSLSATVRKRDKLASQLTWLANRAALGLPEDRRHERVTPRNAVVDLRMDTGEIRRVRLIDVSMSGAAVSTDAPLPLNSRLWLGQTPGKVVRHLPGGMAVEFLLPLSPDRFDENLTL